MLDLKFAPSKMSKIGVSGTNHFESNLVIETTRIADLLCIEVLQGFHTTHML